jgi:hypothetical protein
MEPGEFDKDEFNRRRKSRAVLTAVLLVGLVVLFYLITLVRMQGAQ